MKVWMLGSGSAGNAVLIECDGSHILVDVGFGTRTLAGRLRAAGVHPSAIEACVLTHEHSDHISGAAAAARKWGWPLYASTGTAGARALRSAAVTPFEAGTTLTFSHLKLATVPAPHDATDPICVIVTATRSGMRAGICYDIGHASDGIRAMCRDLDVLVLESNHDEAMLRAGPYPLWLQRRIASPVGHLSNRAAAELACESISSKLAHLVLAHLSEINNTPDIARRSMARASARTGFRGKLSVSSQSGVVGPFAIMRSRPAPTQLSLFSP